MSASRSRRKWEQEWKIQPRLQKYSRIQGMVVRKRRDSDQKNQRGTAKAGSDTLQRRGGKILKSRFKRDEIRSLACAVVIESQSLGCNLDGARIILPHFIHFRGAGENARLAEPRRKLPALCEASETNYPKHKDRHNESGGPHSKSFPLYSQMEFKMQ